MIPLQASRRGQRGVLTLLKPVKKIRKRRARARKAVWQGAREGTSPQRAVTERQRGQTAFLALAHRVACLLACVARAGQPSEGRQHAEGSPQGDAKHRQRRCGYCRCPHALAKPKNPAATRHFVIFSQVLSEKNPVAVFLAQTFGRISRGNSA